MNTLLLRFTALLAALLLMAGCDVPPTALPTNQEGTVPLSVSQDVHPPRASTWNPGQLRQLRLLKQNVEAVQLETSCAAGSGDDCGIRVELLPPENGNTLTADWDICDLETSSGQTVGWACEPNTYAYVDDLNWFDLRISTSSSDAAFNAATCTVDAYADTSNTTDSYSGDIDNPLDVARCAGSSSWLKARRTLGLSGLSACPASSLSGQSLNDWHSSQSEVHTLLGFCSNSSTPCTYTVSSGTTSSQLVVSYAAFIHERPERLKVSCKSGISGDDTPVFTLTLTFPLARNPYTTDPGQLSSETEPLDGLFPYFQQDDRDQDGWGVAPQVPRWLGNFMASPWLESAREVAVLDGIPEDCNDLDPKVFPGAKEACNGLDDNCVLDDEPQSQQCSLDRDQDGADGASDCDDTNPQRYPSATELCNGLDDDCDEQIDEGTKALWVLDVDSDGYARADAPTREACSSSTLAGYSLQTSLHPGEDCDDSYAGIHPGAEEVCDVIDNDCDGAVDEGSVCTGQDLDGDGSAAPADCDDLDPAMAPSLVEVCDGLDNDCDGVVDEGFDGLCLDNDGDGWSESQGDCDDTRPGVFPVLANGTLGTRYTYDDDGDGYGDADDPAAGLSALGSCTPPKYALWLDILALDCNDASSAIHPNGPEACNGIDDNCDGGVDEHACDQDGDGFTVEDGDCDDANPDVSPLALEYPTNGEDDDCDGYEAEIVQADGGECHTLALDSLGRVWAWGCNDDGQLGDGTDVDQYHPSQVVGLDQVIAVAAGYGHSLALRSDGRIFTWGADDYFSDGIPSEVLELSHVIAIAAGQHHSLALLEDGTLWGWGDNFWGQLGTGNDDYQFEPVQVSGLTGVTAVGAGSDTSFAVKSDGSAWAWGSNYCGQLGDGTTVDKFTPAQVAGVSGATAIFAGSHDTYTLTQNKTVISWGCYEAPAHSMGGLSNITSLAVGSGHALALNTSGQVWVWGSNFYGQLGNGSHTSSGSPSLLANVTARAIAAGSDHSFAVTDEGELLAWGYNDRGQVGNGSVGFRARPTTVVDASGMTSVVAAYLYSLALMADGAVKAWGDNRYGQLGDGTTTDRSAPVKVKNLEGVVAIAGGRFYSLALKSDGRIWAWGDNAEGQLGNGTTIDSLSPIQITGPTFIAIAAGYYHTLALKSDGTVWAWGDNYHGQLGDGTTTQRTLPVRVTGLSGIVAIAAGEGHSLALKSDGTVWGWGDNYWGQLGDGTTTDRSVPVQTNNLTSIVAISAGNWFSLARRSDGLVMAWGDNTVCQLGNGTTTDNLLPKLVPRLSDVTAIAAGDFHALVLKVDGSVWAWGGGNSGELGNGSTSNQCSPTQVHDLFLPQKSWQGEDRGHLAAGNEHSLAVPGDASVLAWGDNNFGQLGIGEDTWSPQPVLWGP